jgi:hypothetical protein
MQLAQPNWCAAPPGANANEFYPGSAVQAFDREVWTLDLPALIRAKRAAGRTKDLKVLPELEGLLEAGEQD